MTARVNSFVTCVSLASLKTATRFAFHLKLPVTSLS